MVKFQLSGSWTENNWKYVTITIPLDAPIDNANPIYSVASDDNVLSISACTIMKDPDTSQLTLRVLAGKTGTYKIRGQIVYVVN